MDRLNQLRGDACASRDSSLDTSSLLGEGYITANDSSKYFSLSEVDSNSTDSPSKECANDVIPDTSVAPVDSVLSSLSPIPKNNELDSFKIGAQIEAANILSGGVNIFDDNENSYDGDELVIDDAVTEGDDKPAEIKLSDNEGAFEKPDRSPDSNMEDAETAIPSKDTEVVLQIDGKNVDAIDIGNGLYLYRKDGEEELAAVQILQDDQPQPNIKFLKVRENAEGNLEVYEEIEIEVPKEVPTKEGKTVKNTSHIPIKDIKVNEPASNSAEKKSQAVLKDTSISEVELDMSKDNIPIEARTEVNLNGKMMKFSESRKSPVIGTFTPMTYHSTPNKEGIPLTKTMVDLQLHPNRHSENVKKTIEVHTDNCKQRLIETPVKITKDSNEHNKSSEIVTSFNKGLTNYMIVDGAGETNEECNKDTKLNLTGDITDATIVSKAIGDKKICDKNVANIGIDCKRNVVDVKAAITGTEKPLVATDTICNLNINPLNEGDKSLGAKAPFTEIHTKINTESDDNKTHYKAETALETVIEEKAHSESVEAENVIVNDDITAKSCFEKKHESVSNNKDIVSHKDTINILTENKDINTKSIESLTVSSKNQIETIESNIISSSENDKNVCQSQNTTNKIMEVSPVETTESSLKLKTNKEIRLPNKPSETLNSTTEHLKLVTSKNDSKPEIKQMLDNSSDDVKSNLITESKLPTSKEKEIFKKVELIQNKPITSSRSLKPADTNTDLFGNLPADKEFKVISELNKEKNDCEIMQSEREEIKSNTELKPVKHINKLLSDDDCSSLNPKVDDKSEVNEFEKKSNTTLDKNIDAKLNQIENISSELVTDIIKPVTNKETDLNKYSSNQSCNRKTSLIMKVNTTEKLEMQPKNESSSKIKGSTTEKLDIQKKNELKQKIPVAYKNTKASVTSESKLPQAAKNISIEAERIKNETKKDFAKVNKISIPKPINNNKTAVPFGMWTEANRQEFLNKIKESKVPINTSNTKQLKQPNDLNRRDVLQKIDSQRQSTIASTKVQEQNILNKIKLKNETTVFASKSNVTQKEKLKDNNASALSSKEEEPVFVTPIDHTTVSSSQVNEEKTIAVIPVDMSSVALNIKKDSVHRKEINNQDLIDKTIEGIINRAVTAKLGPENVTNHIKQAEKPHNAVTSYTGVSLDEIESKMNELHGIPFVERPPHELPKVFEHENKSVVTSDVCITAISKNAKLPSSSSISNNSLQKNQSLQKVNQSNNKVNDDSDEEIIEHEPVTGDIQLNKNNVLVQLPVIDKTHSPKTMPNKINNDSKKETIITENDFDKFARRNSITYENCLTVNFDGKEHHNVVQTVIEREAVPKKLSRNEIMLAESKAKSHKQLAVRHINFSSKIPTAAKAEEDSYNKSYQSKVQIAYQTVMTAKRQQECPITIIEDKPVKVVFMDGNHEYIPQQLNVQGKELSPSKKSVTEWDHFTHSNSESLDSDTLDSGNDSKSQDDVKLKSKHQRKQVLTPVETPELELIEPSDLGIEVSPKKKRKIEDTKSEKNSKSMVTKKSYLLNRNITMDNAPSKTQESTPSKEPLNKQDEFVHHKHPISSIDNLVKAAELLETQSETKNVLPLTEQNSVVTQNSPVKRGRGRPRKYPLPGSDNNSSNTVKTPTPQKKPRLIDAKVAKNDTESEDDEINSDGELVKENWTMGKINENIVCPICNKLFRSENVVFKHVKHCTGPSPSRSDSDKRSPRRLRQSQDLDWKSDESKSDSNDDNDDYEINKPTKKRKSKEKKRISNEITSDVIVIEDTPTKIRELSRRKREKLNNDPNKSMVKSKVQHGTNNLVCEFCGKTFRQLSYLVNHRLQHKNTESKKSEKDNVHRSHFNCEICNKEFRKLHHLVQHRPIHNSDSIRTLRKSSSELNSGKVTKEDVKATEDQSAGFRCEPCDKSFRKLHHLVEHRETHDEINKKCSAVNNTSVDATKPTPLHHCDVCKKTFKKLQHLIEHKDHHLDTGSEKSDDKSVKSSLSTKDIIHECPLCYMVFPNEHSLNKHHIICQRKKKQSAAKQVKKNDESDAADIDDESKITETDDENLATLAQKTDADISCVVIEDEVSVVSVKQENNLTEISKTLEQKKEEIDEQVMPAVINVAVRPQIERKSQINEKVTKSISIPKKDDDQNTDKKSVKSNKPVASTTTPLEIIKIPEAMMPKHKLLVKSKTGLPVSKRPKTTNVSLPVANDIKTADSSDDDEIRYMLNPDIPVEKCNERKLFMKVRAKKSSSLQIERPNSKDLMKRRISLQHSPKAPRLKVKPITRKSITTSTIVKSSRITIPAEPAVSTDSDDSDVKYSFPEPVVKEVDKEPEMETKKQKIIQKRKSLSTIAKRKSLGKMVNAKQKVKSPPVKQIRKRTADAEHRCDCGQLFSSAALLARHTSLAHTPPRIRRRRSPPPDDDKPATKRKPKPENPRRPGVTTGVTTRKSSVNGEVKAPADGKTPRTAALAKTRRSALHRGVPVPEKMRKLTEKSKK